MTVVIQPANRMERGAHLADWTARVQALPLDTPDQWDRDTYAALLALITEAFQMHGITHLQGVCPRENVPLVQHWRALIEDLSWGRTVFRNSGWRYVDSADGQRFEWEWVK